MKGLNVYPASGGGAGAGAPVERNFVYGADMEAGQYVGLSPDDNKVHPLLAACGFDPGVMASQAPGFNWYPLSEKVAMLSSSMAVAVSTRTIQSNKIFLRVGIIRGGQVVRWSPAYETPITATTLHNFNVVRVNSNQFALLAVYTNTAVHAHPANVLIAGTATVSGGDVFNVSFSAVLTLSQWDVAPGDIGWMDCAMCNVSDTRIALSYHHNNVGGATMCSNIRIASIASDNTITIGAAIPRVTQTEHNYVEHLACIDAGSPIHLAHTRAVAAGLFVEVDTIAATHPFDVVNRGTPVQLDALNAGRQWGRQYDVCQADTRKLTVVQRSATVTNPYGYIIASYTSDASGNLTIAGSTLTVPMGINTNNQEGWYLTEAGANRVLVGNVHGADGAADINYTSFPALTLFNVSTTPSIVATMRHGAHNRTMHLQGFLDGGVWRFGFLAVTDTSTRGIYAFITGRIASDVITLHGASAHDSGSFLGVTKVAGAAGTANPVYVDGIGPALCPGTFLYSPQRVITNVNLFNPIKLWRIPSAQLQIGIFQELSFPVVLKQVSLTEVKICS